MAENWYNITRQDVVAQRVCGCCFVNTHVVQGGEAVLSHHKGKLAQALTDLLPTVEWNAAKFGGSCTYKINAN